jgi:uncharacterized membrane protein
MTEKTLRLASAGFAVIGAAITAYLLYARWTGATLACTTGGCETVQHSRYAETFGVPVAALGLLAFAGLFVSAAVRGGWARLTQATLALTGLLFGAYLLYIQLAVIGAVCQWCLASDLTTTAITALALLRLRIGATATASARSIFVGSRGSGRSRAG